MKAMILTYTTWSELCNYILLPCVMQSCQVANAVRITVTQWWTQKFSVAEVCASHFISPGTLSECHWIIPSYPPPPKELLQQQTSIFGFTNFLMSVKAKN